MATMNSSIAYAPNGFGADTSPLPDGTMLLFYSAHCNNTMAAYTDEPASAS